MAWRGPSDGVYWYGLQTYGAADAAFRRVYNFYLKSPGAFRKKPNLSDLSYQLRHGPFVQFISGGVFENLRIETLNGGVIDEFRQQNPALLTRVIYPMIVKKRGWLDVLSTPNGFEHFYDLFEKAKLDPEWGTFQSPSTIAPWWNQEEIDRAKRNMSEPEFAQEIMAEFRDLSAGKAYLNHGEWNWRESSPFTHDGSLVSPHLPLLIGLDFNVNPMCWSIGQHLNGSFYWFDRIFVRNTNTQECAVELINRVINHKAGVILCGDSTGSARRTSASASDYAIIQGMLTTAKIRWQNVTPESNPTQKDRINSMNTALKAADGSVTFFYSPTRYPELKNDMQRVTWKPGAQFLLDKTHPDLTHSSDSVGYPVVTLKGNWESKPGLMRTIIR